MNFIQSCNSTGGMWIHKKNLMCIFNVKIFRILSDWQQETWVMHLLQFWHFSLSSQMSLTIEVLNFQTCLLSKVKHIYICSLLFGFYIISFCHKFMHLFIFAFMLLFSKYKALPIVCAIQWLASYRNSLRRIQLNEGVKTFNHMTGTWWGRGPSHVHFPRYVPSLTLYVQYHSPATHSHWALAMCLVQTEMSCEHQILRTWYQKYICKLCHWCFILTACFKYNILIYWVKIKYKINFPVSLYFLNLDLRKLKITKCLFICSFYCFSFWGNINA